MLQCSAIRYCAGSPSAAVTIGDWNKARRVARAVCTDAAVLNPSVIPTRHFQRSLPRLPVPMLGTTLRSYAAAVKPLLPPSQYEETVRQIREFETREGGKLQNELTSVNNANQHTSFVSSDWFEHMLKERAPVPMRRSRTLMVRSPEASPSLDMLAMATLWIRSSVLFYKAYLDNTLYPDVRYVPDDSKAYYQQDWFERTVALCPHYVSASFMNVASGGHAVPLDMSQCDNLFNSTRAPGVLQDEVRAVGYMPHIVVQYRGRQFSVTVADADGNPLPEDQLYARLRAIVTCSASSSRPRVDVGVFTSLPRTEWNAARTGLLRHAKNQKSLEAIDSSMFVVNLDDSDDGGCGDLFQAPAQVLKDGVARRGNRWWDKSISVNVGRAGALSVSYEESWGDGQAVRRYTEDVFQHVMLRLKGGAARVVESSKATEAVQELQWWVPPELERVAVQAQKRLDQQIAGLDSGAGVISGVAGPLSDVDGVACSTDGVVQLAVQLAWWRLNQVPAASAQPLLMNAFKRGRMDRVYASSPECHSFVVAMGASPGSTEARQRCLAALEVYNDSRARVAAGGGIFAHLFALDRVSQRMYGRRPALLTSASYRNIASPALLVSPEEGAAIAAATACPTENGYGVTYTTLSDADASPDRSVLFHVASWKGGDGPRHTAGEFVTAVLEATRDIQALLSQ